ncbi:hypothetical protein ACH518_15235 [Methylomonas sp. HW2-6]|uniref:hypothetical protein n=1 Tax=Methylomonas sp. HW2-6 TaxID=3376687 RepID=UPI004041065A
MVNKIVRKYKDKFEESFNSGWSGRAWIALDISKNHDQYISVSVQVLVRNSWVDELVEHVKPKCPKLTGVIVYRAGPADTHAKILGCQQIVGPISAE